MTEKAKTMQGRIPAVPENALCHNKIYPLFFMLHTSILAMRNLARKKINISTLPSFRYHL